MRVSLKNVENILLTFKQPPVIIIIRNWFWDPVRNPSNPEKKFPHTNPSPLTFTSCKFKIRKNKIINVTLTSVLTAWHHITRNTFYFISFLLHIPILYFINDSFFIARKKCFYKQFIGKNLHSLFHLFFYLWVLLKEILGSSIWCPVM